MSSDADETGAPAMGPLPSLAKPFAVFGAAAGLFAILGIGSFRIAARDVSPLTPMIMTAGVAAVAGEVLRRWKRIHDPKLAREAVVLWVGLVTATAGAVSGGLVGLFTWGLDGFERFAVGGAAVGLGFLPSCLVVFDAGKRAARARHGSLVAATDRRTMMSTVLAGVAFAGATQVPAVLSANVSHSIAPLFQVALSMVACAGATGGILLLQRRDRKDRAALEAHAKESPWLEPAHADELAANEGKLGNGSVDLGLGTDHWARTTDANYRSSGRAEVVLLGSIEHATAAFDECARKRHQSLVVATCGLSAVVMSVALRISVFL